MANPKRDDVGYGRPPREHQFKKGQSGNPAGRPKKAPSMKEHLEHALSRKLTLNLGDGEAIIEAREALAHALVMDALKDKKSNRKLLLQTMVMEGIARPEPEADFDPRGAELLEEFVRLLDTSAKASGDGW